MTSKQLSVFQRNIIFQEVSEFNILPMDIDDGMSARSNISKINKGCTIGSRQPTYLVVNVDVILKLYSVAIVFWN